MARSHPIVHQSSLRIGVEGERDLQPEKHRVTSRLENKEKKIISKPRLLCCLQCNIRRILHCFLGVYCLPYAAYIAVLRIRSVFSGSGSGSADLVFKIRIRIRIQIRVTQKRPDSTGSGSYLDMFLMFSKINIFYDISF